MESTPAAKIKNNKPISKTKLKKTIKNVVCRPDPVEWLLASDEEITNLEAVLKKYSVDVPIYSKPHWNEIKSIPKEKRPKPPKILKAEGLIFGISECRSSIQNRTCSGVLIESDINPKLLAESIIAECRSNSIPYICLKGLRKTCTVNFGIPTSCLGIQKDNLVDIASIIQNIYSKKNHVPVKDEMNKNNITNIEGNESMDVDTSSAVSNYPYLYRKNKKERVFSPSEYTKSDKTKFGGQNFIQLPENQKLDRKSYMNMILKRISSNPNRTKTKNKKT